MPFNDLGEMQLALGPALKRHNVTQAALSEKIGVSKGFISEIVSGKKRPSVETLEKIAKALNTDISELYEKPATFIVRNDQTGSIGFSDAKLAEFSGQREDLSRLLKTFIAPDLKHPTTYIAMVDMIPFAISKGDIIILDLNSSDEGGLVIATISDTDTGTSKTIVRRKVGDALISPNMTDDVIHTDDTPSVGILGIIKGVIRGSGAFAA